MFAVTFGLYHTLPYLLRSLVYSTYRDPALQWRVIRLGDLLMLDNISLLAMISRVLSLSRSSKLGGGLLDFSSDTCDKNKWSSAPVLKSQNSSTVHA